MKVASRSLDELLDVPPTAEDPFEDEGSEPRPLDGPAGGGPSGPPPSPSGSALETLWPWLAKRFFSSPA